MRARAFLFVFVSGNSFSREKQQKPHCAFLKQTKKKDAKKREGRKAKERKKILLFLACSHPPVYALRYHLRWLEKCVLVLGFVVCFDSRRKMTTIENDEDVGKRQRRTKRRRTIIFLPSSFLAVAVAVVVVLVVVAVAAVGVSVAALVIFLRESKHTTKPNTKRHFSSHRRWYLNA